MNYTPAMRALIRAYKKTTSIEKNAVYLFMVPYTCTDTRLQGFMPFNHQFGFVFTGAVGNDAMALARTAAHELAHGTFNLHHTFSTENKFVLPEGSTDNLMDYPSAGSGLTAATDATQLNKYQWDLIHDPQRVWFAWLEEEGEGKYSMPCVGWFDDCKDVLKILETFRNARINGNQVKINGQEKPDERVLIANSVKIGDTDYKRLRLIYKQKSDDYYINPVKYSNYDQQFFVADGTVDWQRGFV